MKLPVNVDDLKCHLTKLVRKNTLQALFKSDSINYEKSEAKQEPIRNVWKRANHPLGNLGSKIRNQNNHPIKDTGDRSEQLTATRSTENTTKSKADTHPFPGGCFHWIELKKSFRAICTTGWKKTTIFYHRQKHDSRRTEALHSMKLKENCIK